MITEHMAPKQKPVVTKVVPEGWAVTLTAQPSGATLAYTGSYKQFWKQCTKSLSINCYVEKLVDSDFVHLFKDGTKLKILSAI